jgi:hypothetical protein
LRTARGAGRRFAVDPFLRCGDRREAPLPVRLVLLVERAVDRAVDVLDRLR